MGGMRALDHLFSLPSVDPARVVVAGLSMGGEVITYVGAMCWRRSATPWSRATPAR
jgi:cephalosporin-C deacetylase-like acetyl esterase